MSIVLPSLLSPAFSAGLALSLSLIMAIGPQNAHVVRMGLRRQHLWLTVATSMLADFVLIALGVLGLAELGGLSDKLQGALVGAGVLFLLVYGWQAGQRCWRPTAGQPLVAGARTDRPMTRRQAVLTALGFSWLNPHAWLDTAVLIGTASLAWGQPGNQLFGAGALTGSLLWFSWLGIATFWLGRRLGSPLLWRVIDGLVALMMWGTAAWLVSGLT
ncbi:MAG: Arginine exporter protein ArgO [Pseudomonadota bacterium]|jgi:L-lysine exporter family protein LysE/ArgO